MVENVKILTFILVYSSLVLHSVACHSLCDLVVKESLCLELSSPPLFPFIFLLCWSFYGGSSSGWQPSQSMNHASWRRMTSSVPTHMDERHRLHLRDRLLPPFTKHIWPRPHNFEATFRSNQLAGDSVVSLCVQTEFFSFNFEQNEQGLSVGDDRRCLVDVWTCCDHCWFMVNKGSGVEWRVLKIGSLFTVLSFIALNCSWVQSIAIALQSIAIESGYRQHAIPRIPIPGMSMYNTFMYMVYKYMCI